MPIGAWQLHVMSDSLVRRKSYSLSFWSEPPVTNELPLLVQAQQRTVFLWPWIVSRHLAVLASHSFTVPSTLPLAIRFPSGLYPTELTQSMWPWMICKQDPGLIALGIFRSG
jgi:hypothetical protein